MGYTALQSGMTTSTLGLSILFTAPILGSILNRLDARKVVVAGFILFNNCTHRKLYSRCNSSLYFSFQIFNRNQSWNVFIPLNTITLSNIQPEDMAGASRTIILLEI